MPPDLGFRLKVARMRAGLDQAEVARRLTTHRVQVSKWERNVNRPEPETLAKLATLYCVSVESLTEEDALPAEDHAWVPSLALRLLVSERVYGVAIEYCRRLVRAGLERDEVEPIERCLLDPRYVRLLRRKGTELSDEERLVLVDDTWEAIREAFSAFGLRV